MTSPFTKEVLTPQAIDFITALQRKFGPVREDLLHKRVQRQTELDRGGLPHFLTETTKIRQSQWQVAHAPKDLEDRRVEITGPASDPKMMINALNSGACVFMADIEDACSPTWTNVIQAQMYLKQAVRRTLSLTLPEGKSYTLSQNPATLVLRPRGWHLNEPNFTVDDKPISASLFDFGLYFFHNAHELLKQGTGPYFYLPKLESYLEARLWNDVFNEAQDKLGMRRGTIRATVLIETILASFEMEEILFELKDHGACLNAGRWDYIFSFIKKLGKNPEFIFPDRAQVTMDTPFMRAYAQLLVQTCHRRGAHAIGGMAAFVPSRKDPKINEIAFAKVEEDKQREVKMGFDGTWVAHPDLVSVAKKVFNSVLGNNPHQKGAMKEDVSIKVQDLLNTKIPEGKISLTGLTNNITVALQYLESWLRGTGAVAIFNLMEDAATAEICRSELWQWIYHRVKLENGQTVTPDLYQTICMQELEKLGGKSKGRYQDALQVLNDLILSQTFVEFLTIPASHYLEKGGNVHVK